MHRTLFRPLRSPIAKASLLASVSVLLAACASSPTFDTPDANFKGRVSVVETPLVIPGTAVKLAGRDFTPGQEVRLTYGGVALGTSQPVVVGADGTFNTQFTVPANAPVGQHPVVVSASKPAAALIHNLKVSPDVPLLNQDSFPITSQKLTHGLYQVATSSKSGHAFVTSAVGRAPVVSELLKVNLQTFAIEGRVTPPAAPAPANAPARQDSAGTPLYAVYGVGVDDVNGTVWVTNTRQNTLAVYSQADLKLVKQFEPGTVAHPNDVAADAKRGKVYISPFGAPHMAVFDAKSLTKTKEIDIATTQRGPGAKAFSPRGMSLDEANGRLYVVSMTTNEVAIIDVQTDTVLKVWPLEGAQSASSVAYDARNDRILVASQGSDNLLIVDAKTGKTLHDVKTGAGALDVTFDPVRNLAYVANRGAGTVTVVNTDGKIVANLAAGTLPNYVLADGKGGVLAINKSRGENDPEGDRISRIAPR